MELISRFFPDPNISFFLFGPRGTGKSTWLNMHFKSSLYIDLLLPDLFRLYTARPERLSELIQGNPDKKLIIIDEIQKIPSLLDVVHNTIEQKKYLRLIITGSSSRKLKRTGINLLAGRLALKTLHPFMAAEVGDKFNLDTALKQGLLPLIFNSKNPTESLSAYISLYLKEEVQME